MPLPHLCYKVGIHCLRRDNAMVCFAVVTISTLLRTVVSSCNGNVSLNCSKHCRCNSNECLLYDWGELCVPRYGSASSMDVTVQKVG